MGNNYQQVQEFHDAMNQPKNANISKDKADVQLLYFRWSLINEEFKEVTEALQSMWSTVYKGNNKQAYYEACAHLLKEFQDLKYVIDGFCATYGWDSDEAFDRVHQSNMSKLPVIKDEDGKVMKGPNYKEPDLSDLVPDLEGEKGVMDNA